MNDNHLAGNKYPASLIDVTSFLIDVISFIDHKKSKTGSEKYE